MGTEAEPQGEDQGKPQGEPDQKDQDEKKPPQGGEKPEPQGDGTDWKAEARKWEKAAKSDAKAKDTAEGQLQALRDVLSGKDSEVTEAEKAKARAELQAEKYRIAYAAGLPPDLAERLKGDTADELKADAESLAKYAKTKKSKSDAKADGGGDEKPDAGALLRQFVGG